MSKRLLLCTDMDGTVIPNTGKPETPGIRDRFREYCDRPDVKLVYVTGRYPALVRKAVEEYALPLPDYAATDVGAALYAVTDTWQEIPGWIRHIAENWKGATQETLRPILQSVSGLRLQEEERQHPYKLSYYTDADETVARAVITTVEHCLLQEGFQCNVIWSVDAVAEEGLLDVMPQRANKLHAIHFLREHLGYAEDEVVFAGDSGNDLAVLESPIRSILVANASDELKRTARNRVEAQGIAETLYIAQGHDTIGNGCYAAGVLEGLEHFVAARS